MPEEDFSFFDIFMAALILSMPLAFLYLVIWYIVMIIGLATGVIE
jgi:hypothetical protein